MHDLRFALPALLLALAVSSGAGAADVASLPAPEPAGRQAASPCREALQAFDQELADVGFGVLPPGGYGLSAPGDYFAYTAYGTQGTPRQRIYALREAAYIYAADQDEESCQLVLATMRKTFEQHQKFVGPEAADRRLGVAWRRAHLEAARPVTEMKRLMRAKIVIGAEIRDPLDEKLGKIEDLVLDPARQDIVYVLATRGGFLGLGGKLVAVRWQDLRVTEDHELYVLNVPKSAFDAAPTVDRANYERTADPSWRQALDQFWDRNVER